MKVINVVGLKKSGKTTLVLKLASFLKNKGCRVCIIKHCHASIDLNEKDSRPAKAASCFILVSPGKTLSFSNKPRSLQDLLSGLRADYVLIEGFKNDTTMPKVVCLRSPADKKEFKSGLEIAFVDVISGTPDKLIRRLLKTIEEKAFKLPGLNCGKCGFKACFDLAKEIVRNKKRPQDCVYSESKAKAWIDGKPLFLNFFVADILKNILLGFVQSLKGGKKEGKIKIEID